MSVYFEKMNDNGREMYRKSSYSLVKQHTYTGMVQCRR